MKYKLLFLVFNIAFAFCARSQNNVLTQHYDLNQSGWHNSEKVLTIRNEQVVIDQCLFLIHFALVF